MPEKVCKLKVVSGGQTGVDRGALDAALAVDNDCGGWCPSGRKAEDGIIDDKYPLTELPSAAYAKRTRQNVIDSDATVIIYIEQITQGGGTELTLLSCIDNHKPYLLIDASTLEAKAAACRLIKFIANYDIHTLNFAGPRLSDAPTLHAYTEAVVLELLHYLNSNNNIVTPN